MDEQTARDLLVRVGARDGEAMRELYGFYYTRIARFVARITRRRELVAEIVNDTFMVVWQKAREFRGDAQISTWILGIAYRRGLSAVGREARAQRDLRAAEPSEETPADNGTEGADVTDWLRHALDQLPFEQRATLELAYYVGLSCGEIATAMQCPINTVKTRMLYARRKLRIALQGPALPEARAVVATDAPRIIEG
jgi:RNA polymerase sigma-70 factor, ECF subfamily